MAQKLIVYGHWVSQPSRAVQWALKMRNVPHQFTEVDPSKGATHQLEYKKKFPLHTIPAIEDEELCICESNAILPYLADKYEWHDWYPKDLKQRAKINEYLCYHVAGTRKCTLLLFRPYLFSVLSGKPIPTPSESDYKEINRVFAYLELLLSKNKYLVSDSVTLADIACYCEIDQLLYTKLFNLEKYSDILRWIGLMRLLPHHDETRKPLKKISAFLEKKSKL